jgi:pantoate--beta-alanine ligase
VRIVYTIAELRAALAGQRPINLVPTMGNLHDGHLSLVRIARERSGVLVTSIFVNRLQFAPQEDFSRYPRTFERDCGLLQSAGCDVVFAPSDQEIYPEAQEYKLVPPAALADIFEGSARPGFFIGVCTVVLKLFHIVRPAAAVFGKKDYQQLLIIRNMVRQLALPVDIVAGETVRDASGLALSSRNSYLTPPELEEAAELNRTLRRIAGAVRSGRIAWPELERSAAAALSARGWRPDYLAIRRQADLGSPSAEDALIIVGAARLGGTRLIDNYEVC